MEESIQSIQFANFSCSDTRRFDLMKLNIERIEKINKHIRIINKYLMWMQPIQKWAYADYADATDQYVASMQAEILASDPGLYVGEKIAIWFYWKSIQTAETGILLKAGKIHINLPAQPQKNPVWIEGILERDNNNFTIKQQHLEAS